MKEERSGEELAERDGQQEACLEAGAVATGIHLLTRRVGVFKRIDYSLHYPVTIILNGNIFKLFRF